MFNNVFCGEKGMKTSKILILSILLGIVVMAAPASAYFSSQSIETKAERMVEIADGALDRVLDLVALVEADETAMEKITDAELDDQFIDNVFLCEEDGEGWIALEAANDYLEAGEYEEAIDSAREALEIFRDVLRSIHVILCEADVEVGQLLDPQIVEEAIERSLDRIAELRSILADTEMLTKLDEAEELLNQAQGLLELEEIDAAKDSLRDANVLISQVCQELKQIAQELDPQRIRDYCQGAYQYRERFMERFGEAGTEGFDVDGFLQGYGYQNEDDFLARFQEMIQNAEGTEEIQNALEELEEIGRMIREMDQNLTQEMGHYRAQHGQTGSMGVYGQDGSTGGFGQNDSGYQQEGSGGGSGGSSGSGQMGFGGGQ
jgi:tetratricopeptide (TPR) repeat protein